MPDSHELAAEIAKCEARLASEPRSRIFAQLADAYRKVGRLDDAIRTCRSGLRDHPTYVSARMVLGRALIERGHLPEAAKELAIVVELSPGNAVAHRLLGDLAAAQGRSDEARERYEAVLQLTPMDREVREAMQRLTEKGPASPPASSGSPSAPFASEDPAMATPAGTEFEKPGHPSAEPATPPAPDPALEMLAGLYAQQGFGERAAEIYRELLRHHPARTDLRQKLERLAADVPIPAAPPDARSEGGDVLPRLERWRQAVRRRKEALQGGAA